MKIQTIESQVWWIALADEVRPREPIPFSTWTSALKQTFQFIDGPSFPKAGEGTEFKLGTWGGTVIDTLSIYSDGIQVRLQSDTRKAEMVLQEALGLFSSLGWREPISAPTHFWVSQIVADFEKPLEGLFPPQLIKSLSEASGLNAVSSVAAIHFNADPLTLPPRVAAVNPTQFRIERRIGQIPYEQNRYFCQAHATTEKHIELLEQLERLA
jgi:hypothetical protein